MKHLIILLSLISTVVITGCGGGNMGGNAAGDPQDEQQIEEPQIMADQDMNEGQPAFGQNIDPNVNLDQINNADQNDGAVVDNIENTENTDVNNNEQAEVDQDNANDQDIDVNDTKDKDNNDDADDKDNDVSTDTEANSTDTQTKDDLITATGTVILAKNESKNAVQTIDNFAAELDPAKERDKIRERRVASADNSGGEEMPDLATELEK